MLVPLILGLVSTPLFAGEYRHQVGFTDKARVLKVTPVYEVVEVPTDHRECWTEEVRGERRSGAGAGVLMGSIIGGVIGHQFGGGDGRKLATVAGSVMGAAVGANAERQSRRSEPYVNTERHCAVRTDYVKEERLRAYQVTYRYHGETFVTEMDRDPGKFVRVRVQVSLID